MIKIHKPRQVNRDNKAERNEPATKDEAEDGTLVPLTTFLGIFCIRKCPMMERRSTSSKLTNPMGSMLTRLKVSVNFKRTTFEHLGVSSGECYDYFYRNWSSRYMFL